MDAFPDPMDWAVLSRLLRQAQGEGWRVRFQGLRVELLRAEPVPGVITLPAPLLRRAREAGWLVGRGPMRACLVLRHPAVRHRVDLMMLG